MSRPKTWMVLVVALAASVVGGVAVAQSVSQPSFSPAPDSPAARFRPIGSASAVDQYRQRPASTSPAILRETGYRNNAFDSVSANQQVNVESGSVRQTAMQFALPGGGGAAVAPPITSPAPSFTTPNFNSPNAASPAPPQAAPPLPQSFVQQVPNSQLPGQSNLPFPAPTTAAPLQPRTDYAPIAAPSLGGSISNINNCANVTGPSGYSAAFGSGCGGVAPVTFQTPVSQTFQAPTSQIVAPAVLPGQQFNAPVAIPAQAATNPAPLGSLVTFGQERNPVQVGQGIIGQPKAYVPGQTFRNILRYFTP